jgi:Protein of unknown function (DUF3383)
MATTVAAIPASALVNIFPSVLGVGGTATELNGLCLSTNLYTPYGSDLAFSNAADVATFYGPNSDEAKIATIYFNGYSTATNTPATLYFSWFNGHMSRGAFLWGGSLDGVPLSHIQASSGTIQFTLNGAVETSDPIDLSSATSFSNAADIIQAAFAPIDGAWTYDAFQQRFQFASTGTGDAITIPNAAGGTGNISTNLNLTSAEGATRSNGHDYSTGGAEMDAIVARTPNWGTFFYAHEYGSSVKIELAQWASDQKNKYAMILWDSDPANLTNNQNNNAPQQVIDLGLGGIIMLFSDPVSSVVFGPGNAAFVSGAIASIDFARRNARISLAYKHQDGLHVDVQSQSEADQLVANGLNYYGVWATNDQRLRGLAPGSITGEFLWIDSFVNQMWLSRSFQSALMNFLFSVNSIPYNQPGYAQIAAVCQDPIDQGVNFGMIVPGVTLSNSQVAAINAAAGGRDVASVVQQRGWYLLIDDASPVVRVARGSPPITFWYSDGQSVHKINLASIAVQ